MTKNNLASFKIRLLSFLTDRFIFFLPHAIGLMFVASSNNLQSLVVNFLFYVALAALPFAIFRAFFYNAIFNSKFGGNLGKLITGLRVVNNDGKLLTFRRNFFRHTVGFQLSLLLFGLGFWSIIKDENKQGWHDKAVGSKVVVATNLWPLSLIALIILAIANFTLVANSIQRISSGSIPTEALTLYSQIQEQSEQENEFNIENPVDFENFENFEDIGGLDKEQFFDEELPEKLDQIEDIESI